MKANLVVCLCFTLISCFLISLTGCTQHRETKPLKLGYSISVTKMTPETMAYAKSVGVDYVETSFNAFLERSDKIKLRKLKYSDHEIMEQVKKAKKAADQAGIKIWSVHMPSSRHIDLSLADEDERQGVVDFQKRILNFCRVLKPQIILFHPSWFLGLNERKVRTAQLVKSARELNDEVKALNATMVIENMLGSKLLLNGGKQERPLCRTVEESVEIFQQMPESIGSAVDMNHIKKPEKLIRAMGKRLKTVHVADGDGKKECHYFPCSGKGENNWVEILSALNEVNYSGPFMFESAYEDVKDMKICYYSLYNKYMNERK